jgi:hypothetical protein
MYWLPVTEEFEKLVKANALEGVVENVEVTPDVIITSPPEKFLEVLNTIDIQTLFDFQDPLILKKQKAIDK